MAETDITQTPFTPLAGEDAIQNQVAEDSKPLLPKDPGLEAFFGPSRIEKARTYLAQADQEANGFMPHFLATMAALKGQFGPAIALQQRKQQTTFAKGMLPYMDQINTLMNQGDFKGARQVADELTTQVGTRMPDAIPGFKAISDRVAKREEDVLNADAWFEVQKGKLAGPDDPRAQMVKTIDAVRKKRPLIGMEMIKEWAKDLEIQHQVIEGTLYDTTKATLGAQATPMEQFAKQGEQQDIVGNLIAGQHGITPTELTNVLNRVQTGKGSEQDKAIVQDYITMLPYRAALEARRLVPGEPILNTQLSSQGVPLVDIAAGTQSGQIQSAIAAHNARLVGQAEAPILANILKNPFMAEGAGYVPINIDPTHGEFLSVAGPTSVNDYNAINANGPKLKFVPKADADRMRVVYQAIQGLRYVNDMQAAYGDASTPIARMERGINRAVSDYLGIPVTSNMALGKAAQLMAERSIEEVERTKSVDDKVVRELKTLITGRFTDDAQALAAANKVQMRLREELGRIVGTKVVPESEVINAVQQKQGVEPTAPQGGAIQPGPGAAPGATTLQPNKRIQQDYKKWQLK